MLSKARLRSIYKGKPYIHAFADMHGLHCGWSVKYSNWWETKLLTEHFRTFERAAEFATIKSWGYRT